MKVPPLLVRRLVQLLIGCSLLGASSAFLVRGNLGAASWDVLTQGITRHVSLSFGLIGIITSFIVLLLWIPLKQKLGIGTVVNIILVGIAVDMSFVVIPVSDVLWIRILYVCIGIGLGGLSTGLYIGARFGTGPRDGLMTGLNRVTGLPIWIVRTTIEVSVVVLGWLLGGVVGLSTVVFALLIGPVCQYFMRLFHITLPSDKPIGENYDAEPITLAGDEADAAASAIDPEPVQAVTHQLGQRKRRVRFAGKQRNG